MPLGNTAFFTGAAGAADEVLVWPRRAVEPLKWACAELRSMPEVDFATVGLMA